MKRGKGEVFPFPFLIWFARAARLHRGTCEGGRRSWATHAQGRMQHRLRNENERYFSDVVRARAELGMPAGSSQLFRDRSAIRPIQERVRKQFATAGTRSLQGVARKASRWGAKKGDKRYLSYEI